MLLGALASIPASGFTEGQGRGQESQIGHGYRLVVLDVTTGMEEVGEWQGPTQPAWDGKTRLTLGEVFLVYAAAGVPSTWQKDMADIAFCESSGGRDTVNLLAEGDSGNSVGFHQIGKSRPGWDGWFIPAGLNEEMWSDPLVNTRAALYIREYRGRFGGAGGWTCADLLGIP